MKRLFQIMALSLILYSFPGSALTILDNANTTADIIYDNSSFIDTQYTLNSSDSFFYVETWRTIRRYPYQIGYTVNDSKNNKLQIFTAYEMVTDGFFTDTLRIRVSAKLNNAPVLLKTSFERDSYEFNMTYEVTPIPFFDQKAEHDLSFSGRVISFYDGAKIKNFDMELNKNYYFNTINLPNSSADFSFNSIVIKYRDNGISSVKYDIDNAYYDLNPVFRFLFLIFKALIAIINGLTFGWVISDTDVLSYQSYIITPLSFIDNLIDYIFAMIRFIFVMGFLWCFMIVSMILFIFSYTQSKDIIETFSNFALNEYKFISIVVIKPVLWVYDKLILEIISKIRG